MRHLLSIIVSARRLDGSDGQNCWKTKDQPNWTCTDKHTVTIGNAFARQTYSMDTCAQFSALVTLTSFASDQEIGLTKSRPTSNTNTIYTFLLYIFEVKWFQPITTAWKRPSIIKFDSSRFSPAYSQTRPTPDASRTQKSWCVPCSSVSSSSSSSSS